MAAKSRTQSATVTVLGGADTGASFPPNRSPRGNYFSAFLFWSGLRSGRESFVDACAACEQAGCISDGIEAAALSGLC